MLMIAEEQPNRVFGAVPVANKPPVALVFGTNLIVNANIYN
jgi:hypothetical protein